MLLLEKDYDQYPKFRHNLWTNYKDEPNITYLTVSHGTYEVSTEEANRFLAFRSHCTGHNDCNEIARRSGQSEKSISNIIKSLIDNDILHLKIQPLHTQSKQQIRETLHAAVTIWGEQLADTHISREIFDGKTSRNVVIGWLLETYHYIKLFPEALNFAARSASGKLKEILLTYANQEIGHEQFILKCLLSVGLSKEEVETSIPLISTRTIDFLLRELFVFAPASVLLVASIIEADSFDAEAGERAAQNLCQAHHFPINMLAPFFEHVALDCRLDHQALLKNNIEFIDEISNDKIHDIINKLHDIKHAFDLQKLEIYNYYDTQGNYIPRQFVDYYAI